MGDSWWMVLTHGGMRSDYWMAGAFLITGWMMPIFPQINVFMFLWFHMFHGWLLFHIIPEKMEEHYIYTVLLMEEILLTSWYGTYPIVCRGFIHVRWLAGFLSHQQYQFVHGVVLPRKEMAENKWVNKVSYNPCKCFTNPPTWNGAQRRAMFFALLYRPPKVKVESKIETPR